MARQLTEQSLLLKAQHGQEIAFGQLVQRCYSKTLQLAFTLYGRISIAKEKVAFVFAVTKAKLAHCQDLAQYELLLWGRLIQDYLRSERFWDNWSWYAMGWSRSPSWYPLASLPWLDLGPSHQSQHAIRSALAPLAGLPRVAWVLLAVWQLPMGQACRLTGCFAWRLRWAYGKANRQLACAHRQQHELQQSKVPSLVLLQGHGP